MTQRDEAPRLFFYFLRHYHKVAGILETALKSEGVTAGQYTILSALKRYEPCTSAALARNQQITAQSMGEYLSALEAKGLVVRGHESGNRRNIMVRRSDLGIETQARCDQIILDAEKKYLAAIPEAERDNFVGQLSQLYRQ